MVYKDEKFINELAEKIVEKMKLNENKNDEEKIMSYLIDNDDTDHSYRDLDTISKIINRLIGPTLNILKKMEKKKLIKSYKLKGSDILYYKAIKDSNGNNKKNR